MKVALCLLTIACSAVALPAEDPFHMLDEIDFSQLKSNNVYLEPLHPAKTVDLPGSRIVGGAEVAPHAAPYQAALIIDGGSLCGGSLITTIRVLSAAHCTISASYVQIILGAHLYAENESSQVRVTSTSVINHELYANFAYDVSILFLPSPVSLNDYIDVIPLAPVGAQAYYGYWGFLTGWGHTTDSSTNVAAPGLRGVYVNVMSNPECSSIYGDVIQNVHLCTSGAGIVGGCGGDSGGPLVIDGVQVGVQAFTSTRCQSGNPTGFTRISSVRYWIAQYS